jgi:hypothetical protein
MEGAEIRLGRADPSEVAASALLPTDVAFFSADGEIVTVGASQVHRWTPEGSLASSAALGEDAMGVLGAPSGVWIATAMPDGAVRLGGLGAAPDLPLRDWDLGAAARLVAATDGRWLVGGFTSGRVVLWSTDGSRVSVLQDAGPAARAVAIAEGTARVAVGSEDGTARVWDPSGALLTAVRHEAPVRSVDFAPDGSLLLTASEDGTARLWRLPGGEETSVVRGTGSPLVAAAFSRDGTRFTTVGARGEISTWYVGREDLLRLAKERSLRELTEDERARYGPLLEGR